MRATWAVAGSIVREVARRKMFYGVALFAVVLILLVPALPSIGVGIQVQPLSQKGTDPGTDGSLQPWHPGLRPEDSRSATAPLVSRD